MTRILLIICVAFVLTCCGGIAFGADMNPVKITEDTALWTGVVFLILVFGLGHFAFKPIVKALDERQTAISNQIAGAEQANADAKSVLEEYKQKLADAHEEVRQILETARKEGQRTADGIIGKAKEAAHQENLRAMKDIETAAAVALQQIAEKSATLAANLAGKMIRAQVSPDNHKEIIRRAVEDFSKI